MKTYLPKPKSWPDALYNLCTTDTKTRRADYSVTELIQPPQMLQLKRRHESEMTIDPADMLWRIFGKLTHGKLEAVGGSQALTEEGLIAEVGGVTVSGQPDLYEREIIWDYKVTSTYAVKDGPKAEWEQQLNLYACLFRRYGFAVKGLRIVAILRDWSATKAKREEGYPANQIQIIDVPVWDFTEAELFLCERVTIHNAAAVVSDEGLPQVFGCSDDERWMRPTKWAVMKKGAKKALKLHDNAEQAEAHALEVGGVVEHRPGEYLRCAEYCEAAPFCKQLHRSVDQVLTEAGL
jgi:hypothetical protein